MHSSFNDQCFSCPSSWTTKGKKSSSDCIHNPTSSLSQTFINIYRRKFFASCWQQRLSLLSLTIKICRLPSGPSFFFFSWFIHPNRFLVSVSARLFIDYRQFRSQCWSSFVGYQFPCRWPVTGNSWPMENVTDTIVIARLAISWSFGQQSIVSNPQSGFSQCCSPAAGPSLLDSRRTGPAYPQPIERDVDDGAKDRQGVSCSVVIHLWMNAGKLVITKITSWLVPGQFWR